MEYYYFILSIPILFTGGLAISMIKDYIQISYMYQNEKNKIN